MSYIPRKIVDAFLSACRHVGYCGMKEVEAMFV